MVLLGPFGRNPQASPRSRGYSRFLRRAPAVICFHGQTVSFSRELRYLLADEEAATVLGERPLTRAYPEEDPWKLALGEALDLFDEAGKGPEAYEWLVTPNAQIGNERPLSLLQQGASDEALRLIRWHLAHQNRRGSRP
jgi:hypothetical protein